MLFSLLFWYLSAKADTLPQGACKLEKDKILDEWVMREPEVEPVFPGGLDSLVMFLSRNLHIPYREDIEQPYYASSFPSFIIDTSGRVSKIRFGDHIHAFSVLDSAVQHVIVKMPVWKPGRCNGVAVPVLYTLPVRL
ncbi:hypothetical protein DXN04_17850 [Chitinophaga silvisoli]|uniref:TonB C-terminal domain-containing protein n=1 Tax=Chitinophaga silvisoli TaxID=2291814 RepID=A0A3E1P0U8_9BACT|nr:hypothetical protein DXN04_17850 [Chitinophaga silvisoli]